jgi:uncharacterized protein (TIGR02118 family)
MMKSICVLARREDTSREAFHAYYEESHAPLALEHFPFRRYVRNHLLDSIDPGFDTISEFWAQDTTALASLMEGPVGELLRADEQRFMAQSKTAPAGSREHVFSPGTIGRQRFALLLNWKGEDEMIVDWAARLAADTPGVYMDVVTSWRTPAFPARAVLWTPDIKDIPDSFSGLTVRALRVRSCETVVAAPDHGRATSDMQL